MEAVGIGGVINFIVPELNKLYSGWETNQPWRRNCHKLIINDKNVYLTLLKRFKTTCKNYPLYTKDCLCKSYNGDSFQWSDNKNKQLYNEIRSL